MIFYFLILGLIIVIGIVKNNSKLIILALIGLMWLLISNNYYNADYEMYIGYYQKYGISETLYNTEILFQLMCKISYNLNFSYEIFLKFYYFIALTLIYLAINKMSNKKFIALLCYIIFPFFLDTVQVRHFMATALVCYGFACLVKDKNGEKKYLLLNLLALGFHYNAIFYLPLILVKKIKFKKFIFPFIFLIAFATLIIKTDVFINILQLIIPSDKIYAYFISSRWNSGTLAFIIYGGLQILSLTIIAIIYSIAKLETPEKKELKYVLTANVLLLIVLPFYSFTIEFTRVFRGFILINYIAILNSQDKYLSKNNLLRKILLSILIASLFYLLIIYVGIMDTTIINIFEYNRLFN